MSKEHIITLGRPIDYEEYCNTVSIRALVDEANRKLASGEIVIPNSNPGDVVRVGGLPDEEGWYRNNGLYMLDNNTLIPLDYHIDEYGHVPIQFYWPKFPNDYWFNVISHNRLIPVRFYEAYNFTAEDVETFKVKVHHESGRFSKFIDISAIETPDFLIVYPSREKITEDEVANKIMTARHVEVVPGDIGEIPYITNNMWYVSYEDFKTNKTIFVIVPDEIYKRVNYSLD